MKEISVMVLSVTRQLDYVPILISSPIDFHNNYTQQWLYSYIVYIDLQTKVEQGDVCMWDRFEPNHL